MTAANIEIEQHFHPDHQALHYASVRFTCPHLRIQQPAITVESQRRWIASYLRLHDAYGPKSCTADLRERYGVPDD